MKIKINRSNSFLNLACLLAAIPVAFLLGAAVLLLLYHRRLRRDGISPESIPTRIVQSNSWEFRLHESGRGPALLLLHGIGANLFCWASVIPLLNRKFRVIAVDLPGFGGSAKKDMVDALVYYLRGTPE